MKNSAWRGRKKVHEWDFMGHDMETGVEYGLCAHCNKLSFWGDKPDGERTIITEKQFLDRIREGKVEGDDGIFKIEDWE